MTRSIVGALAVVIALAAVAGGCASSRDVARDGKALEARLDPSRRGYCPPDVLARGLAEVGFARAATERGDGLAAASHLSRAEAFADLADRAPCARGNLAPDGPAVPPVPDVPRLAPPDLDGDGIPDASDPDDDGDGFNDTIDQCPTAAEDFDGFEDIDGCPDAAPPPQVVPTQGVPPQDVPK